MRAVHMALVAMAGAIPALAGPGTTGGSVLAFTSGAKRSFLPDLPAAPLVQIQEMAAHLAASPSACSDAYLLLEFDEVRASCPCISMFLLLLLSPPPSRSTPIATRVLCADTPAGQFNAHTLTARPAADAVKQQVLAAPDLAGAAHVSGPAPLSAELAQALETKCGPAEVGAQWAVVTPSDLAVLGDGMAAVPSRRVRLQADLAHESDAVADAMQQFATLHPAGTVLLSAREAPAASSRVHRRALGSDQVTVRDLAQAQAAAQKKKASRKQSSTFVSEYQFFTSDLLLAAIVVSTLFVPVVWVFIKLLADIQTPDRLGEKSALTQMAKKAQ